MDNQGNGLDYITRTHFVSDEFEDIVAAQNEVHNYVILGCDESQEIKKE